MAGWVSDLRHVVRRLARRPGVVSLPVATLAPGIGLNTAAFAVACGGLWRPLAYPDAGRLVTLTALYHENEAAGGFDPVRFREWAERLRVADLAGYETRERSVRGTGPARIARVATVTDRFFDVLGVPAAAGVAPPLPAGDPRAVVSTRLAAALSAAPAGVVGLGITIGDAPDERAETPDVVVSASTARFLHPDADAVGRGPRFALERFGIARETTVQGVVADMKYSGLEAGPAASIYVPWRHRPMGLAHLVVRTAGDPSGLLPAVRDLILSLDPNLPVPEVRTLDDHVADSIAGRRLQLVPAAVVGGLALLVAMVGVFGALTRAVTERRRELAIRAAIGASPARLVRLIMRGSLAVGAVGVAVGLAGAAGVGRGLSSLLYGVGPYDAATFAAVAGSVLVATSVASLLPARRAARVDPLIALKGD